MYLTLKDCAELAHINVSSARFYKDKDEFRHYFKTTGEGKKIKYEEKSTVEVLQFISKSYTEGLDADQIVNLMDNKFGMIVTDLTAQSPDNTTEVTQQEDLTHSLRLMLQQELNRRDELILELQEEIQSIKEILLKQDERNEDRRRRSEGRDNNIMQRINEIRLEQQRNKPWWKRILNRT